jgi:hypothetical protein
MYTRCYVFALAKNAEDAQREVQVWLDNDYDHKEYWDSASVMFIELYSGDFVESLADSIQDSYQKCLTYWRGYFSDSVSDDVLGFAHIRYGQLLSEYPCPDMPCYNIQTGDYCLPTEDMRLRNSKGDYPVNWYAVKVHFHY